MHRRFPLRLLDMKGVLKRKLLVRAKTVVQRNRGVDRLEIEKIEGVVERFEESFDLIAIHMGYP